jgi:hypothetical protein
LHFWCAKEAAWKREHGTIPTLKQLPLHFVEESRDGMRFEGVATIALPHLIVALSN